MRNKSTDELVRILWDYNNLHQKIKKTDVVITLGSHDVRVAKRGTELYLQKYAPIIVFSGGFGRLTGDWAKPEAEVFADIATRMGIPKEKILIENKSTNTEENLRFSVNLLNKNGIFPKSVILVHKPYMERRQFATWKKLFPEIEVYVASPQVSYDEYILNSDISKDDTINIIVGDTQRIKIYPKRGFMVSQEMPVDVWSAYKELAKRGFTKQLVKE